MSFTIYVQSKGLMVVFQQRFRERKACMLKKKTMFLTINSRHVLSVLGLCYTTFNPVAYQDIKLQKIWMSAKKSKTQGFTDKQKTLHLKILLETFRSISGKQKNIYRTTYVMLRSIFEYVKRFQLGPLSYVPLRMYSY